jgi:hypothetical protein
MRKSDLLLAFYGFAIALAVLGVIGVVVNRLSTTGPAVTAAVLVSVAGVLAAVPPIIKALRGR